MKCCDLSTEIHRGGRLVEENMMKVDNYLIVCKSKDIMSSFENINV
jgi:hypothetical protein